MSDNAKLIAEARSNEHAWGTPAGAMRLIHRLANALEAAQQVRLDRDKVQHWLAREFGSFLAHDPHNPERFWGGSARALCDAAERGELT